MKRPIEFRAQRADTREWVYGYLAEKDVINIPIHDETTGYHGYDDVLIIPETVGQFTVLLDRNGKKIFEGDKLHRMMGVIWIVAFDKHQWRAISQTDSGLYFNANEFNEFEVIGTIHDKPETDFYTTKFGRPPRITKPTAKS